MIERFIEGLGKHKEIVLALAVGVLLSKSLVTGILDKVLASRTEGRYVASEQPITKGYVDTRIDDLNEKSALRNTEAVALLKSLSDRIDNQSNAIKVLSDRIYDLARTRHASYVMGAQ